MWLLSRGNALILFVIISFSSLLAIFYFLFTVGISSLASSLIKEDQIHSTFDLIEHLKSSNKKPLKAFTFIQNTIRFDENEKAVDTSTWYEAIRYPTEFRIDYGDKSDRNANINRNDSIYVFRNNKLVHSGKKIQEFLILEGGIHFYSTDKAISKLQSLGINTSIFSTSNYKGRAIYIIGAEAEDLSVPQIWLDKEHLYSVRRISKSTRSGNLYDVKYDDYKKNNGYWIETWIEFYRDGKLIQTERYNNIDVNPKLNDKIFNPKLFGEYYWY